MKRPPTRSPLCLLLLLSVVLLIQGTTPIASAERPHIVLVMADDMGWGQTGYYQHPVLKTPHLDAMAANGLRFDRFYAGAPVCSPTRASVLTGRTNDRTGVANHGSPLRLQEKFLATALRDAGYATGHFGKWHLNGLRGPGAPVLADDSHRPSAFGFETWLTVTNYFDLDPLMGSAEGFVELKGDSSEVTVAEALKFIGKEVAAGRPTFTVIWYGTPHSPFRALEEDAALFADLDEKSQHHYGELVAMDRSIGTLRAGLRELGVGDDTLLWFTSDNGGLSGIKPETVGGLRGNKGTVFEGGLRVPGIIEWPAGIREPRVTKFPAATMDIFPTLADLLELPDGVMLEPVDGISLVPLFAAERGAREKPIGFRHNANAAFIDNQYKLVRVKGAFSLYDLETDPAESKDLSETMPEEAARLRAAFLEWEASVEKSVAGGDYPEGKVLDQPERRFWTEDPAYESHFDRFSERPEYESWIKRKRGQ